MLAAARSRGSAVFQSKVLLFGLMAALAAALCLAAFRAAEPSRPPLNGRDVSAQRWTAGFSLLDTAGRRRTLADFRDKTVLLAFGYTRCPDACPTTLARLARVRELLGPDAPQVQVIFVTIDPERDSAALLDNYMRAFDPSFVALRGSASETDAAAQAFHANYQLLQYGKETLVEHTVDTYLVDAGARVREVLPYQLSADEVAADVRRALHQTP